MVRLGAIGLAVLGQVAGPTVDAIDGRYELPDGRRFEAVGVCQIDPAGIRCWSREGGPAPEITKKIEAFYLVQGSTDVSFRPGRKNLYTVFRYPTSLGPQFVSRDGSYLPTSQFNEDNSYLTWARALVSPEDKTFEVFANLPQIRQLAPTTLPFVKGRTTEIQAVQFEVGDWSPTPQRPGGPFNQGFDRWGTQGGKAWSVTLLRRSPAPLNFDFSFAPLDKKGDLVGYVDAKGRPISEAKFNELGGNGYGGGFGGANGGKPPQAFRASFNYYYNAEGATTASTNIDPAQIGAIRITPSEKASVRFSGLPANPN